MNQISFLNRGYAFKGLLAVTMQFTFQRHHMCSQGEVAQMMYSYAVVMRPDSGPLVY